MQSQTILWFLDPGTVNGKGFLLISLLLVRFTVIVMGRTVDEPVHSSNHHYHHHNYHQQQQHNSHTHHLHHHHQHHHHQHNANHHQQQQQPHQYPHQSQDETRSNNQMTVDDLVNSDDLKPCVKCSSLDRELFVKLKLEAIKKQILSKLQLKSQPNVTLNLPRELVLEALKRSKLDVGDSYYSSSPSPSTSSSSSSSLSSSRSSTDSYQSTQSISSQHLGDSQDYDSIYNINGESPLSDDYYGTTSEIITFPEPGGEVNGHTLLELTPPHNRINSLEVTSANLWIQVRLRSQQPSRSMKQFLESHKISLYIFKVLKNISPADNSTVTNGQQQRSTSPSNLDLEMIALKKFHAHRTGWKQIDLRSAVQRWFNSANSMADKLTLLVDCVGCESLVDFVLFENNNQQQRSTNKETGKKETGNGNSKTENRKHGHSPSSPSSFPSSSHSSRTGSARFRPFLVINTKPRTAKRAKRGLSTCDSTVKHCCKQSLYVNFTELGWDNWIIAPQGYYANYCVGDCTKPFKTPDVFAYHHSMIVDKYRQVNPYASISPCCAPTRLSAMSFIYIGPRSNIVKTDLPKMIVEECGCT